MILKLQLFIFLILKECGGPISSKNYKILNALWALYRVFWHICRATWLPIFIKLQDSGREYEKPTTNKLKKDKKKKR